MEIIQPNSHILQMKKTRDTDGEECIQVPMGLRPEPRPLNLKFKSSIQFSILPKRLGLRVSQPLHVRCHFLPHLKEAGRKRQK